MTEDKGRTSTPYRQPGFSKLDEDEVSATSHHDDDKEEDHITLQHRSKKDHGDALNAVHIHRVSIKEIGGKVERPCD